MEGYLAEGDPTLAAQSYEACVQSCGPWPLEASVLRSLVREFGRAGLLPEAKPFIEELVARFPGLGLRDEAACFARVLIEHEQRPASGLAVLESIPAHASLTVEEHRTLDVLTQEAHRLIDDGVLELD
jgi:hypothetical protein